MGFGVTTVPPPMKHWFFLAALSASACAAPIDDLIPALVQVESGGNDQAIGDSGRARGALQIWPAVVQDVNRLTGSHYRHADVHDRHVAEKICRAYLAHYASAKRLGHEASLEELARIWNGGPNGHRKPATLKYWAKVKENL